MLFTDSNGCTPEKMLALDGECQAVLAAASKTGQPAPLLSDICSQNWAECRSKLETSLASFSTFVGLSGMQNHLSAVMNTGGGFGGYGARPRLRLQQVVLSDTYYDNSISPLERWMTYSALALLFQTMANRLDSKDKACDRYEKKRAFYQKESARWWRMILVQGIPAVQAYLSRPGALHDYNAGTWDNTALSLTTGETVWTQPVQAKIAITYVDQSKYISPLHKHNAESAPSDALDVNAPPNQQLTVSIENLNPQSTSNAPHLGISQPIAPMLNASGWHVYAGQVNGPLYLQTVSGPIPISQKTYTILEFKFSGITLGRAQVPIINCLFGNISQRG